MKEGIALLLHYPDLKSKFIKSILYCKCQTILETLWMYISFTAPAANSLLEIL